MPLLQSSIYSIRLVSPSSLSVFKLYGLSSLVCRISSIPIRFSSRSSCPRHSILVPFPPLRFLILGRLYQRSLPQVNVPRIRPLQFNSFVYLRSFFPPTLPCITLLPRITKSNKRGEETGGGGGGESPCTARGPRLLGRNIGSYSGIQDVAVDTRWNGASGQKCTIVTGHVWGHKRNQCMEASSRKYFPPKISKKFFVSFPQFSKKFLSPVKQYLYISFVPILSPDSPHLLQLRFHLGLSY